LFFPHGYAFGGVVENPHDRAKADEVALGLSEKYRYE
jgi:hypothetical protein